MVGPRLELAPAVLALVAQVELVAVVARHVHALVGVVLVGNVLQAQAHFDKVLITAKGIRERMVAGLVARRSHLVAPQPLRWLVAGGRAGGLEVAGRLVVVGLGGGAVVAQAHLLGGVGGREVEAHAVAIAAIKSASLALDAPALAGEGEFGRGRVDLDGGANAVTAHADRGNASEHTHAAHARGVDVRQGRIHVVAAGRNQIHAVHLDAQPIVGQAMHAGQAGDTARAKQAHSGHAAQQVGGVAAGRAARLKGAGVQVAGAHGFHSGLGCLDGDGLECGLLLCEGRKGQGSQQGAQGAQGRKRAAAKGVRTGVGVHVCNTEKDGRRAHAAGPQPKAAGTAGEKTGGVQLRRKPEGPAQGGASWRAVVSGQRWVQF